MSFPRYSAYRDGGIQPLGEIPAHWQVLPLKRIAEIRYGIGEPPGYVEDGTPLIRATNIHAGKLFTNGLVYVDPDVISKKRIVWLTPGDIIVVRSGAYTGDSAIIPRWIGPCIAGFDMVVTCRLANARFIQYCLLSKYLKEWQIDIEKTRAAQPHLNAEELGSCRVVLPDAHEQAVIVEFLDCETAKIDALIIEQERLLELLKEKLNAAISHAVTKGLNQKAQMKPSGVEWLGDVPKHWQVMPLKRIVDMPITDGPHETPAFIDEGVPFVSAEAVSSGDIDFAKIRGFIADADNAKYSLKYAPRLHDIYMVKSGATTGTAAIVEGRTDFNIWSPLAAIRCGSNAIPHFILNFVRSKNFQEAVALNWTFGTQQNIGMGVLENLSCVVPPRDEQEEILQYVTRWQSRVMALTVEAKMAIDLLQERRSALISAAVTGQIDVRGLVEREAA
jgi:type I restriction enzyme S subunit